MSERNEKYQTAKIQRIYLLSILFRTHTQNKINNAEKISRLKEESKTKKKKKIRQISEQSRKEEEITNRKQKETTTKKNRNENFPSVTQLSCTAKRSLNLKMRFRN